MPFSKPVTGKGSGITMISMDQWFSKCESQTYLISISWELVRNTDSSHIPTSSTLQPVD